MVEDFEHIGRRLKAAREAAGLSVDDVVFRTQFTRPVVEALESEDFAAFASPVYSKSFLAQYSDFLNVDAGPWLDALEPGAFVAGGLLNPVVEAPAMAAVSRGASKPESQSGWLPMAGLLALSAALVFTAIKSFDFFEARFGRESRLQPEANLPVVNTPAAIPIRKVPTRKPSIIKEDEQLGEPPPRAIIVK